MICYNILERERERERSARPHRTALSDFRTDTAKTPRIYAAHEKHAWRNGYTINVPLSPYIIRPIGRRDHAIFRIGERPWRRNSPRCITREISHVGTAALGEIENSVLALHVAKPNWWLMPASPRLSYLTYLDSRAAYMHGCSISPVHIHCPPCIFLAGYFYLGDAQFSLYGPTIGSDYYTVYAKRCRVDKIKYN